MCCYRGGNDSDNWDFKADKKKETKKREHCRCEEQDRVDQIAKKSCQRRLERVTDQEKYPVAVLHCICWGGCWDRNGYLYDEFLPVWTFLQWGVEEDAPSLYAADLMSALLFISAVWHRWSFPLLVCCQLQIWRVMMWCHVSHITTRKSGETRHVPTLRRAKNLKSSSAEQSFLWFWLSLY